jgi:polymerase delta-interacting protein 2
VILLLNRRMTVRRWLHANRLLASALQESPSCTSLRRFSGSRLEPVGILEPPEDKEYATGQLFLHRVFGYRAIILNSWETKLYDRDETLDKTSATSSTKKTPQESDDSGEASRPRVAPEEVGRAHAAASQFQMAAYYSVLMDERDWKHVKYRTQTEGVTFLHESEENSPFFTIPGLDYASQEDVLPYSSISQRPIHHNLLDKFIAYEPTKDPPFSARHALVDWSARNRHWLEPTDVYRETTNTIRVTVIPFYMGLKRKNNDSLQYWWRYCIRLENLGSADVQLTERNWRIFSMNGSLETVRARGVNGVEPILSTEMPAFQYSSHVSLYTPSGHMWGTFRVRLKSGKSFDVKVPPFALESKSDDSKPEN